MAHTPTRSRVNTLVIVCVIVLMALALSPRPAYAHAQLITSVPANGEQVTAVPEEIVINYSMGVQVATIVVLNSDSEEVHEEVIIDTDWTIVRIPMKSGLGDGVYTIKWEALAEDGHYTDGSFFFIVGQTAIDRNSFADLMFTEDTSLNVNAEEPAIRGFLFLGLITLLGVPLTMMVVINPTLRIHTITPNGDHTNRIKRLLIAATLIWILAAVGIVVSQLLTVYGVIGVQDATIFLTTTPAGGLLLLRVAPALVLLGILLFVRSERIWLWTAILVGAISLYSISWNSHTSAMMGSPELLSDAGHLIGAASWGGGLIVLALLLPGILRHADSEQARGATSSIIRRFSTLAITGLAFAVGTGFLLTSYHFLDWGDFISTLYGFSLTSKLALLLFAVGLGGLHRFVMLRQLKAADDPTPHVWKFIRSVRLELVLVIGIFFLAGLITSAPPPHIVAAAEAEKEPKVYAETVSGTDVQLEILPEKIGLNLFDISLTQNGVPVPAEKVENLVILMRHPETEVQLPNVQMEALEEVGKFSSLSSFTAPGDWRMRVSGMVDGTFTSQTFVVTVPEKGAPADATATGGGTMEHDMSAMDHDMSAMGEESTGFLGIPFQQWMTYLAFATVFLAIIALSYEFIDHTRERKMGTNV